MTWQDLSGEFNFGDTVSAAEINALHANFTAICSGDASSPKFKNRALAQGPAVGKNGPKTSVNSESDGRSGAGLGGERPVNVGSFSFFPCLLMKGGSFANSQYLSFTAASAPGSVAVVQATGNESSAPTLKASRILEY